MKEQRLESDLEVAKMDSRQKQDKYQQEQIKDLERQKLALKRQLEQE